MSGGFELNITTINVTVETASASSSANVSPPIKKLLEYAQIHVPEVQVMIVPRFDMQDSDQGVLLYLVQVCLQALSNPQLGAKTRGNMIAIYTVTCVMLNQTLSTQSLRAYKQRAKASNARGAFCGLCELVGLNPAENANVAEMARRLALLDDVIDKKAPKAGASYTWA